MNVEYGADGLPVAFRIWKAGDNVTDFGVHRFTSRSAKLLLQEQATRGNLISIDVDHLSLKPEAPPEARKAVGWHRLAVRNGELWAVNVQWTDAVRAGLVSEPPAWRYVSPAYDVDQGEIVSYLNTALTNNPATHDVTALATRRVSIAASRTGAASVFGIASAGIRAARSTPAVARDIAERFNRQTETPTIHWEGNTLVFPMIDAEEAARVLARHQKAGPLPRGATLDRHQVLMAARAAKGQPHR